MNRTQGYSNRALTMVCGATHQKVVRTQTQQQPQYSGPFKTVNTKCCMSATSSRKPLFVQVFRKKHKTYFSRRKICEKNERRELVIKHRRADSFGVRRLRRILCRATHERIHQALQSNKISRCGKSGNSLQHHGRFSR